MAVLFCITKKMSMSLLAFSVLACVVKQSDNTVFLVHGGCCTCTEEEEEDATKTIESAIAKSTEVGPAVGISEVADPTRSTTPEPQEPHDGGSAGAGGAAAVPPDTNNTAAASTSPGTSNSPTGTTPTGTGATPTGTNGEGGQQKPADPAPGADKNSSGGGQGSTIPEKRPIEYGCVVPAVIAGGVTGGAAGYAIAGLPCLSAGTAVLVGSVGTGCVAGAALCGGVAHAHGEKAILSKAKKILDHAESGVKAVDDKLKVGPFPGSRVVGVAGEFFSRVPYLAQNCPGASGHLLTGVKGTVFLAGGTAVVAAASIGGVDRLIKSKMDQSPYRSAVRGAVAPAVGAVVAATAGAASLTGAVPFLAAGATAVACGTVGYFVGEKNPEQKNANNNGDSKTPEQSAAAGGAAVVAGVAPPS